MPRDVSYSDGRTVHNAVIVVWEDLRFTRGLHQWQVMK